MFPPGTKLFAAVRRGDCRFSQKAENAANAGFAGLVILDDQSDTDTPRISGIHSEHLDSFPVIFLLKTEARILEKHLMESSSLSMAIQVLNQRKGLHNKYIFSIVFIPSLHSCSFIKLTT